MSDDSTSGWTPPQQPEPCREHAAAPDGPPMSADSMSGWMPAATARCRIAGRDIPPPPLAHRVATARVAGVRRRHRPSADLAAGDGDDRRRRVAGDGPIGERSGSSKKVLIGAVVGVLAIGAAGVFAVTQMSDGNSGGAASPEELGEAFMESIDQEDVLGAIDLLLPGERDTFSEPVQELVSELKRFEVLSRGCVARRRQRPRRHCSRIATCSVEGTNVDDIVNITMFADATATVNGEELPIGDLVTDSFGEDVEMGELTDPKSGLDFELPMTAVEEDGRWYLSYFYTLAEDARRRTRTSPRPGSSRAAAIRRKARST